MLGAAVVLAGAAILLVRAAWRRSVLAFFCGTLGFASAVASTIAGSGQSAYALAGALAGVTIGTVLLLLARGVQRLLDEEPDDGA
jgi:hypothetical protein